MSREDWKYLGADILSPFRAAASPWLYQMRDRLSWALTFFVAAFTRKRAVAWSNSFAAAARLLERRR